MRVLVISRNAWDDTNAIGNTLSNFFTGVEGIEFASIYFRSAKPNNCLCKRYYCTSEIEVLKKWFVPHKIGRTFTLEKGKETQQCDSAEKHEKTLIRMIRKSGMSLAYKLSDYIWCSKKWINDNLKVYVESFSPDLIFTFVKAAPQYYLTVRFLRENYHIPLISWIADDEYTGLMHRNAHRESDQLKYILNESVAVRGCSEEICTYYNSVFQCSAMPLYKGCDLSTPVKKTVNQPLKIVYAGNLLYGRLEILRKIADVLEEHPQEVSFAIYSNTPLSSAEQNWFAERPRTRYMGQRDYATIKQELAEADIVLHAESFDDTQILKTKYSFSTKIIDCLQSGSVLLAVGPNELASIKYVKRIPGAFVIDDLEQLREKLLHFLSDSSALCERAERIRAFAQTHHDASMNAKALEEMMRKIVEGDL